MDEERRKHKSIASPMTTFAIEVPLCETSASAAIPTSSSGGPRFERAAAGPELLLIDTEIAGLKDNQRLRFLAAIGSPDESAVGADEFCGPTPAGE
jgi:hypothetical protein